MDDQNISGFEIEGVKMSLAPENGGAYTVSADLGPLPEDGADALVGEMLEANHAFQGTAGATLSVDPGIGHVFLRRRLWPDDSDEDSILPEIAVFAGKAREWRERIAEKGSLEQCNLFYNIV